MNMSSEVSLRENSSETRSESGSEISEDDLASETKNVYVESINSKRLRNTTQMCKTTYRLY